MDSCAIHPKPHHTKRSSSLARVLLALLLALCLGENAALAADCVVPSPGVANVALRSASTAKSDQVGTLGAGNALPLVASLPRWYEVRLADGQSAFAAKQSSDIAPCAAPDKPTSTVAGGATYELHAIDVGTGLAVLVLGPDFSLLYDAGSNDDIALGARNRAVAYLSTLQPQLKTIKHVVLSHPHRDHVELLPDIVKRFKPREVWNSGAYNDICGYRHFLLAIAADASIQYHTATQDGGTSQIALAPKTCYGDKQPKQTVTLKHAKRITNEPIALGEGASMTFLYADGSKRSSFNENSLVVRLDLGSKRVLFMGDAEAGGRAAPKETPKKSSIEGKLLDCCRDDLKADVLVVGHHGSKTSSRQAFLDAVDATIFIISAGPTKYATVVLPDADVIAELETRIEGTDKRLFRTDLEDDACATSPDKVGPDADGKPGGCDNVLVVIPANGPIAADYRRVAD